MAVFIDDRCIDINDAADLDYVNSHHNWMDTAVGTSFGTRYELSMQYGSSSSELSWVCLLSFVDEETGSAIRDPALMIPTGGPIGATFTAWTLPVIINEFMPNNAAVLQDEAGDFDPWIELYNRDSGIVDLSGWRLSNDAANPSSWVIPEGTVLSSRKYLVITADGEVDEGPLHTDFMLSSEGGELVLTAPDGVTSGERAYGPVSSDESVIYDYIVDGFVPATAPTPGAENPESGN